MSAPFSVFKLFENSISPFTVPVAPVPVIPERVFTVAVPVIFADKSAKLNLKVSYPT